MGIKRIVDTSFWTDGKVDDFSPEDKYFMLYLLTNPFSTQLGIYEISIKQVAFQMGYSVDAVKVLIDRFENKYGMIIYSPETNEIAIKNFLQHSIIKGGAPVRDCLIKEMKAVKAKHLIADVFAHLQSKPTYNETVNNTVKSIITEFQNSGIDIPCGNDTGYDTGYDTGTIRGQNADNENENENENENDNENLSIYHQESKRAEKKPTIDRLIDGHTISDIQDQIEYKILKERISQGELDMAVSCIADLYTVTTPQKFNNRDYSPELIRRRSLSINSSHIEYVFECLHNQREKIGNIRSYLTTAIFNAPDSMGAYYSNKCRADGAIW